MNTLADNEEKQKVTINDAVTGKPRFSETVIKYSGVDYRNLQRELLRHSFEVEKKPMKRLDLSGIFLSLMCFYDTDFSGSIFKGCRMRASWFENCIFDGCDFSYTDLPMADFKGNTFRHCDFTGANLEQANFIGCKFISCSFHDTDLPSAYLNQASFRKCGPQEVLRSAGLEARHPYLEDKTALEALADGTADMEEA